MKTPEILKQLRNEKGLSQQSLAEMLELSTSAYGFYEQGKNVPPIDVMNKLADIYNVSVDYIIGRTKGKNTEKRIDNNRKIVSIPVLGKIAAGIPIEAIEDIEDYEEIVIPSSHNAKDYFCLIVNGDSMLPRISNNDVVVCKKQYDADTGDIVAVYVNGSEVTLKKIQKTKSGLSLVPTNPVFEAKFFNWEEVEELPVKIIGKVIELRAKF